jgi:hypothetical protein
MGGNEKGAAGEAKEVMGKNAGFLWQDWPVYLLALPGAKKPTPMGRR